LRFEKCIEQGLIKRDPEAIERVKGSLEIAERFLRSAKKNLEIEEYEVVEIAAYNSAFHSARALLLQKATLREAITVLTLPSKVSTVVRSWIFSAPSTVSGLPGMRCNTVAFSLAETMQIL